MAKYATEGNISHLSTLIIGWVKGLFSSANPLMDGTVAAGTSYKIAREDHRHPTDTSRAPYTPDETAIAANDEIVFADNSDSYHIKRSTIKFDGSTATKALTQKGTWETFNNYSLPTANGSTKGGVTLSDATNGTEGVSGGKAATPKAVADALAAAKSYADANDSDTTYDAFVPATSTANGTQGLVPPPSSGHLKILTSLNIENVTPTTPWRLLENIINYELENNDQSAEAGFLHIDGIDGFTAKTGSLMTSAEKTKLSGIASGAEVNQNAFSNVKVGSTTVAADGKTDTLELVAGSNVTLTPDATNDKVTIAATNTDTKNTAGSNQDTAKLYLVGAKSQTTGSNGAQTYSNSNVYETNGDLHASMFNGGHFELSGNYWTIGDTNHVVQIPNGANYVLADACTKAIGSVADGDTGLVTGDAVYDAINNVLATSAALVYQGTIGASADSPTITSLPATHSKGDVYVVKTAGTYAGKACEVGDMIICNTDGGSANNAHWDVIQSNIEPLTNTEIETAWQAGLTANGF